MDVFVIFLLYYLSQKPELLESLKPLAKARENSEQTLQFLENVKAFSALFDEAGTNSNHFQAESQPKKKTQPNEESQNDKQNRQSPFQGIADELLQQYLDEYLKNG